MNTTVDLNIQVRKHKFGVTHSYPKLCSVPYLFRQGLLSWCCPPPGSPALCCTCPSPCPAFLLPSAGGSLLRSGRRSCPESPAPGRMWRWGKTGGVLRRSGRRMARIIPEKGCNQVMQHDVNVVLALLTFLSTYSNILEAHANDEVGSPVGKACYGHRSRPWTLREQLGYEEPGDGTWPHFKEGHKTKDGQHADVAHPWHTILSGGIWKSSEVRRENDCGRKTHRQVSQTDQ